MGGQLGVCAMGLFVTFDRYGRFKYAMKGNSVLTDIVDYENTRFWFCMGFFCDVLSCVFCWLPKWVVLLCPLGVVGGVVCGDLMGVSTGVVLGDPWGFPTKYALIKDESIRVALFRL